MERPVQSFKSFIQTVPPLPDSADGKSLPPVPNPLIDTISAPSLSPIPHPLKRESSVSSWKAPLEWDGLNMFGTRPRDSPLIRTRQYSLLLPETTPELLDMPEEPSSWPCNLSPIRRTHEETMEDENCYIPPIPPRSPLRGSASTTQSLKNACAVPEIYSVDSLPQDLPSERSPNMFHEVLRSQKSREPLVRSSSEPTTWMPISPFIQRILRDPLSNNDSARNSAYKQWIAQPNSQPAVTHPPDQWESKDPPYSPDLWGNSHADGPRPTPSRPLNVSHHHDEPSSVPLAKANMIPRPLSWKKEDNSANLNIQACESTGSWAPVKASGRTHHKKPFLTHLSQWMDSSRQRRRETDHAPHTAGDGAIGTRNPVPGPEVDKILNDKSHFSNLIPLIGRLIPQYKQRTDAIHGRNGNVSPNTLSQATPQFDSPKPLLRLPGGLALVRQSPTPSPYLERNVFVGELESSNTSQYLLDVESSVSIRSEVHQRSSSMYSEHAVAPTIMTSKRQRTSSSSPTSPTSASKDSLPIQSPLVHEMTLSTTPPPCETGTQRNHKRADSGTEDSLHILGIPFVLFDRARDACDTWKQHKRDAKHGRLKQSIRVLGPTDPSVIAGYINYEGKRTTSDGG